MFKFLPKPPIPGLYHVILTFIVIWTIVGLLLNWLNNAHVSEAHVSEAHVSEAHVSEAHVSEPVHVEASQQEVALSERLELRTEA